MILSILFLFFLPLSISASGFYIETIGSLDVQGSAYPQYWYTGTNPTITGKAPANASITATIDGTTQTVAADAAGTWSVVTSISEGDHTITLSTESITPYTFTLTIGAAPDGVGGITAPDTPPAGVGGPTIALITVAFSMLFASVVFIRRGFIRV